MLKIKKLLEPYIWLKRLTLEQSVGYFVRGLIPVLGILFTKYLMGFLEQNNFSAYYKQLLYIVIIIGITFFIHFLVSGWSWVKGYRSYQLIIREKYLKKILFIDNNIFDKIGTGNLIAIVDKGISSWATILVNIIRNFWSLIITLAINIYFISKMEWIYIPAFLCLLLLIILLMLSVDKYMIKWRNVRREHQREGTRKTIKLFMSKFDILQNNKIDNELKSISESSIGAIMANKKMRNHTEVFFLTPQILVYTLIIVFFYIGGNRVLHNTMTFANFYGIVASLFLLQSMLDKVSTVIKDATKDMADIEKLRDLANNSPQIRGIATGSEFSYKTGDINFKNVGFSYNKNNYILKNFNLFIKGGKRTALVGVSGAGKTTIVKLIAGYIHPIDGMVVVDNQVLPTVTGSADEISLSTYYKNIGYLTQEPSVFDGNVYENLIFSLQEKPDDKVIAEVIEKAQCQFIYELPKGLDTQIGEKGIRLSGGQRQRLAIAKIILKDPNIILLDEPTSALDSLSEEAVTKALDILFENRTVIVVAHRLQTVKKADDIIVLEKGSIVERGSHEELILKGGQYAKMLELQSGF